eukprot:549532_1
MGNSKSSRNKTQKQNKKPITDIKPKIEYKDSPVYGKNITEKVTLKDYSSDRNYYKINNIFNEKDKVWKAFETDSNPWVIFDSHGYQITHMSIKHRYELSTITISHNNDFKTDFQPLLQFECDEKQQEQIISFNKNIPSRLIKLSFNSNDTDILQVQFYGVISDKGEQNDNVLYSWEEFKNIKQIEDEKAENVSGSYLLKIIETFPKTPNYSSANDMLSSDDIYYWLSERNNNLKQDAFIILDMNGIIINTLDIKLHKDYSAKIILLYTCFDINDEQLKWNLLATNTNIKEGEDIKLYLQSKNEKYIKIVIKERTKDQIGIVELKCNGYEPVIKDEISNKIKIFQSSPTAPGSGFEADGVLHKNEQSWKSDCGLKSFLIFDCDKYEIDRIIIRFQQQCKPQIMTLKLSEVANAYAFNSKSIPKKIFEFKVPEKYEREEWNDTQLNEIIDNVADIYKSGYKRYLQLEFSKYMSSCMEIISCRFFGRLSDQIASDSEQFDCDLDKQNNDEKVNENGLYTPQVMEHSVASMSYKSCSIENIFEDNMDMFYFAMKNDTACIIMDSGNNKVDEILLKSSIKGYPCKQCKISSCSTFKAKTSDWNVICFDKKYENNSKGKGVTYAIKQKHAKYIKIEFMKAIKNNIYSLRNLKLIGKSNFLNQKEILITMNDIINMKHIDQDLVYKYKHQQQQQIYEDINVINDRMDELSDSKKDRKEKISKTTKRNILYSRLRNIDLECVAYIQPTIFEQEEIKTMLTHEQKVQAEYSQQESKLQIEAAAQLNVKLNQVRIASEKYSNAFNSRSKAVYKKTYNDAELERLRIDMDSKKAALDEYNKNHENSELYALQLVMKQKMDAMQMTKNIDNDKVYNEWKESIQHDAMIISDKYNVMEYEAMIEWAKQNKSKELKVCWMKLGDLLDDSLDNKKQMLHKYHLFNLSANYTGSSKSKQRENPEPFILFDCGHRKLDRIELEFGSFTNIAKITICTAKEIIYIDSEEKNARDIDSDPVEIDWNNFDVIHSVEFEHDPRSANKIHTQNGFETKCELNFKNERYVKVSFVDPGFIRMIQFYAESNDENEMDQIDSQKACHRLKLTENMKNIPGLKDSMEKAYQFDPIEAFYSNYFAQTADSDPYLIFDCEKRQVERFEIKFRSESETSFTAPFRDFTVSTSNDNDINGIWNTLWNYKKDDLNKSSWIEQYMKQCKTIQLECKNKRYLRFDFVQNGWNIFQMNHLKFFTIDSDEQKSEREVKNLTSKMVIIAATDSQNGGIIENMFNNNKYKTYKPRSSPYTIKYKDQIDCRIRDEICSTLNKYRKNGRISVEEKHFIKFLLCWQNPLHFTEILNTSKRIMNILKKSLDNEYKQLVDNESKILQLQLDKKFRLPAIIVSNHGLLQWNYNKWYQYRKAIFGDELKEIAEEWIQIGLVVKDKEFKHLTRNINNKTFTSCDELAMEY